MTNSEADRNDRDSLASSPIPAAIDWRAILLLMAVVATAHFNRLGMSVAGAERIIPQAGITTTRMGWVYTAFLLVYTLCMIPGGWVVDRFGPRLALLVVCGGSALFTALTAVVGWTWREPLALWIGLLIVRSLMGMTNASLHPSAARAVFGWVPPSAVSLTNGLVSAAACGGMAASYLVVGKLIDWFDWPGAFLIASGWTIALALAWAAWIKEDRPKSGRHDVTASESGVSPSSARDTQSAQPTLITLVADRSLICLTASYAALGYFQYLFFYWMEYYFDTALHFDTSTSRLLSTVMILAMGVGMVVGGWLADRADEWRPLRFPHRVVPIAGMLAGAAALLAGLLTPLPNVTIGCFIVSMAAAGMCEGSFWTNAVAVGRSRGGTAAAIMNTGGNAGGLLAPVVTPYIANSFGQQVGWSLAVATCLVGAVLWCWIDAPEPRDSDTSP